MGSDETFSFAEDEMQSERNDHYCPAAALRRCDCSSAALTVADGSGRRGPCT